MAPTTHEAKGKLRALSEYEYKEPVAHGAKRKPRAPPQSDYEQGLGAPDDLADSESETVVALHR